MLVCLVVADTYKVLQIYIKRTIDKEDSVSNRLETNENKRLLEIENLATEILQEMTIEDKISQMFIVEPEQLSNNNAVTNIDDDIKQYLSNHCLGGIVLFDKNLDNRNQTVQMIEDFQLSAKIINDKKLSLFISVDEEGGSVSRIGNNNNMKTTKIEAMGEVSDNHRAYEIGSTIGAEIKQLGFNLDFAPVADINTNPNNHVIGSRAFGSDPNRVAELINYCVSGFANSGIICTLKHFPGHGSTEEDSHNGIAINNKTLKELEECELLPFRSGISAGAEAVMVGHISCPSITNDTIPASLSQKIVTDLLRNKLSFEGIIVTDAINMEAITNRYDSAAASVKAIQAGVDMILMPEDFNFAIAGVKKALANGDISEQSINNSVKRILKLKIKKEIIKEYSSLPNE